MTFQRGGEAWKARLRGVTAAFSRVQRVPALSLFGRGMASSAYGVSLVLHAAEYTDLPPPKICSALTSATARMVDRRGDMSGFAGIRAELLVGRPAERSSVAVAGGASRRQMRPVEALRAGPEDRFRGNRSFEIVSLIYIR